MFVGSVSHIRVAVKFVYAVRVAVGVWKGVLRCILQRCCSAMVLPSVCCSGCVVGHDTVCVAVELLCKFCNSKFVCNACCSGCVDSVGVV